METKNIEQKNELNQAFDVKVDLFLAIKLRIDEKISMAYKKIFLKEFMSFASFKNNFLSCVIFFIMTVLFL